MGSWKRPDTVEGDTFPQHLCAGLEDLLQVALRLAQGPAGLELAIIPWA